MEVSSRMNAHTFSYPLLTCEQAKALERRLLTEPSAEWAAMQAAGRGIAQQVVRDYAELRPVPEHLRVLALVGKGHNGGDALLCCGHLLAEFPRAKVTLLIACEPAEMRPLTQRAYAELEGRVLVHRVAAESGQTDLHLLLEEGIRATRI
jgi:NAD(P)H-hydrate epimerase